MKTNAENFKCNRCWYNYPPLLKLKKKDERNLVFNKGKIIDDSTEKIQTHTLIHCVSPFSSY